MLLSLCSGDDRAAADVIVYGRRVYSEQIVDMAFDTDDSAYETDGVG